MRARSTSPVASRLVSAYGTGARGFDTVWGSDTAGALLVSAGDNPERLRRSRDGLRGISLLASPAGRRFFSALTTHKRLTAVGATRAPTTRSGAIVMVRMGFTMHVLRA